METSARPERRSERDAASSYQGPAAERRQDLVVSASGVRGCAGRRKLPRCPGGAVSLAGAAWARPAAAAVVAGPSSVGAGVGNIELVLVV